MATDKPLGYHDPGYVATLAGFGAPLQLAHSKGWIIKRQIPGTSFHDAMGPYPVFQCPFWDRIETDIIELRQSGLVSVVLVSDPMIDPANLFGSFDIVRPFKTHYIADLSVPSEDIASRHHRRDARRASKALEVVVADEPSRYVNEWCDLHEALCRRHGIVGFRAFSREAFDGLFRLENLVYMRALKNGNVVGGQVFLRSTTTAFAHLAAFTDAGYASGASYILDRTAIDHFRNKVAFIDWGGGLAAYGEPHDNLTRYKMGWSTMERTSYLLGVVPNQKLYRSMVRDFERAESAYFPAYRAGEFDNAG